jgi:hypothetical protein
MDRDKLLNLRQEFGYTSPEVYKAITEALEVNPSDINCLKELWEFYITDYSLSKAMEVAVKIKELINEDYYVEVAKANSQGALNTIEGKIGEFGDIKKLKEVFPDSRFIRIREREKWGIMSEEEMKDLLDSL